MRKFFLFCVVLMSLAMPLAAHAAIVPQFLPLVPCGGYTDAGTAQPLCTPCDLFKTFNNIINFILFGITGPVAAFMIVVAGGWMLISRGDTAQFKKGKDLLYNTLIGVGIILVSWVVVNSLINALGGGTTGTHWYEFSCPASLASITNTDTQFLAGPAPAFNPPAVQPPPPGTGVQFTGSTLNLCMPTAGVKCGACTAYQAVINGAANGAASAKLLGSIMQFESACGHNLKSPKGAYGLMQMLPGTAIGVATPAVRDRCHLYEQNKDGTDDKTHPIPMSAGWLLGATDAVQAPKALCLAAAYLNQISGACGTDPRNLSAGYNEGPGWCGASVDCVGATSCSGGPVQKWECLWDNTAHTVPNTGLAETRNYAPNVAACAR